MGLVQLALRRAPPFRPAQLVVRCHPHGHSGLRQRSHAQGWWALLGGLHPAWGNMPPRDRAVLDGVVSASEAHELVHVWRVLAAEGYRPGVRACTLRDVALSAPHLLVPLVRGAL